MNFKKFSFRIWGWKPWEELSHFGNCLQNNLPFWKHMLFRDDTFFPSLCHVQNLLIKYNYKLLLWAFFFNYFFKCHHFITFYFQFINYLGNGVLFKTVEFLRRMQKWFYLGFSTCQKQRCCESYLRPMIHSLLLLHHLNTLYLPGD